MIEAQAGADGTQDAEAAAAEQAHNEKMIQVAETGDVNAGDGEGETLLAGKYKTEEDLQKGALELLVKQNGGNLEDAYKALEQAQGSADGSDDASDEGSGDDGEDEAGSGGTDGDESSDVKIEQADLDKFTEEYAENGELSKESYEKLEKSGIPKDMVDAYISGEEAKLQLTVQKVHERVGGEENYNAMLAWANEGYTEAEQKAFNEAIASQDETQMNTAIDALKTRFTASNGFETSRLRPGHGGNGGQGDVYGSWKEAQADMSDPRYGKDPAFTKQVEAKVGRSKI